MGKGTEVGKHETWVEINEESGSSGKKKKSVCWGVVGDEVGRWAGMLQFPGWVGGHSSDSLWKSKGKDWAAAGFAVWPMVGWGGWQEAATASLSFCPAPRLFRCYATRS